MAFRRPRRWRRACARVGQCADQQRRHARAPPPKAWAFAANRISSSPRIS